MIHEQIIKNFRNLKILVVGDYILDKYIWGEVNRISPEAPVPVVHVRKYEYRLGGAGNVAANLAGLGCKTAALGVVGNDEEGETLKNLLTEIDCEMLLTNSHKKRKTTTKTRVIAHKQQIVRIDEEDVSDISKDTLKTLLGLIDDSFNQFDGVIISDYAKGVITSPLSGHVINKFRETEKIVVVDPKGLNYRKYLGATLIKPNFQEFKQAVNRPDLDLENIAEYAQRLSEKLELEGMVVTLGDKGVFIRNPRGEDLLIPTRAKDVYDVSGAGDTFVAAFTAALIACGDWFVSGEIANLASGIVVGKVGTVPINYTELLKNTVDR